MQLHVIDEKDKTATLPRVNHQFIGLGHELETHRRQRKQAQLQHQAMENRVLLLEKQESKAPKDLIKKKRQLEQIINIRERQQLENQQVTIFLSLESSKPSIKNVITRKAAKTERNQPINPQKQLREHSEPTP